MEEFLREFRAKYPGAYDAIPDDELAQAIYRKFYADKMEFEEFAARVGAKHGIQADAPTSTGPTRQPPFAAIDRGVDVPGLGRMSLGGALDALVAFGGAPAGLVSGDTRDYLSGLVGRNPKTTAGLMGAGGVATALATRGAFGRHQAAQQAAQRSQEVQRIANETARYIRPPSSIPPPAPATPAASPLMNLIKNKWLKRTALGGLGLDYLYNRVLGR